MIDSLVSLSFLSFFFLGGGGEKDLYVCFFIVYSSPPPPLFYFLISRISLSIFDSFLIKAWRLSICSEKYVVYI